MTENGKWSCAALQSQMKNAEGSNWSHSKLFSETDPVVQNGKWSLKKKKFPKEAWFILWGSKYNFLNTVIYLTTSLESKCTYLCKSASQKLLKPSPNASSDNQLFIVVIVLILLVLQDLQILPVLSLLSSTVPSLALFFGPIVNKSDHRGQLD